MARSRVGGGDDPGLVRAPHATDHSDMQGADLYRILQVDPAAEIAVIKAAHRALATTHHPDAGGSHDDMAAINHAWTVLSDPAARAAYDQQRRLREGTARWDAYGRAARAAAAGEGGTILEFGRYAGWTIPDIARTDPDYLEWLVRTPNGRRYQPEIDRSLGRGPASAARVDPMVRAHERPQV